MSARCGSRRAGTETDQPPRAAPLFALVLEPPAELLAELMSSLEGWEPALDTLDAGRKTVASMWLGPAQRCDKRR